MSRFSGDRARAENAHNPPRGDEDNSCPLDELFELRRFVTEQPVLIFFSAAIG
jgi:hypothetical protein